MPSEEEQLRLALEDSDNWETVQTKEKRKGKKTSQPQQQEKIEVTREEKSSYERPPLVPPTGPGKQWEVHLESTDDDGNVREYVKVLQDSEWEVA